MPPHASRKTGVCTPHRGGSSRGGGLGRAPVVDCEQHRAGVVDESAHKIAVRVERAKDVAAPVQIEDDGHPLVLQPVSPTRHGCAVTVSRTRDGYVSEASRKRLTHHLLTQPPAARQLLAALGRQPRVGPSGRG